MSPGTRIGPYEILGCIGKGGMGEVYRARDSRMGRDVAVKVSNEQFNERFSREVHAVAALNHPNICHLYDVGSNYLVMELVEGQTLGEHLTSAGVTLAGALEIAKQIAMALDAAHEKGIIHRDLKPGNIKITPDGVIKVLDFGLAKISSDSIAAGSAENSPTLSLASATRTGVILGTAGYMAPEQARGNPVDKRADVWAFGVVLYEMCTGKRLFHGDTVSDTLAAVLMTEPDWERVPSQVQPLLRRCLVKDPKRRLRDMGDVLALLEDTPEAEAPARASRKPWLPWAIAGVVLAALLPGNILHFREAAPATPEVTRFRMALPDRVGLTPAQAFAVSPDGHKLAFAGVDAAGTRRIWIRPLDALDARPLTAITANVSSIFWSPDSRSIAFQDARLKRMDVSGGTPATICDLEGVVRGGTWNAGGIVLFAGPQGGIQRATVEGGKPVSVTVLDPARGEVSHRFPEFLPDGKHFLYLRTSRDAELTGIYIGSIDGDPAAVTGRPLVTTGFGARYAPSGDPGRGWILYRREDALVAQGFEPRALRLAGEPLELTRELAANQTVQGAFTASQNGVLVYHVNATRGYQLTWFDRQGKSLGPVGEPGLYGTFKLSPDASRVVIGRLDPTLGSTDLWLIDMARGTSARFTSDPSMDDQPVWSPDGSRIAFRSNRGGSWGIYVKPSNSSEDETLLVATRTIPSLTEWTRNGYLLYFAADPQTKEDIWAVPMEGDHKPIAVLKTGFNENAAYLSSDGQWLAYMSDESGRSEVYVQPFRPTGEGPPAGKWMVSQGTLGMARWRSDGKQLTYLSREGKIMAVDITAKPAVAGAPVPLFDAPPALLRLSATPGQFGDATGDGKRFLFAVPVDQAQRDEFTVVLNWPSALPRR